MEVILLFGLIRILRMNDLVSMAILLSDVDIFTGFLSQDRSD